MAGRNSYNAHENAIEHVLDGAPLATFLQRMAAFLIDLALVFALWLLLEIVWHRLAGHRGRTRLVWNFHDLGNVVAMLLYHGSCNYLGNGRTPGKWLCGVRIVSLTHARLSLWQSIERALGYGAAALELGLGFLQYFWSRNRMCAQDRLAETIVLDVRRKARRRGRA